jgi:hypothetical protein
MQVMRFYLAYSGPLSGSGNKPKPDEVRDIRDQFHSQLTFLWQTHAALKRLRWTARVVQRPYDYIPGMVDSPFGREDEPPVEIPDGYVDLCSPIQRGGKQYRPLVRKSLDLTCCLKIIFLRQEDPGSLVLQGGDLDNRIKTLFDAFRLPDENVEKRYPQAQELTCCLLENDTLISGFSVSTGRLLIPESDRPNEVRLIIEADVRVLLAGAWNVALMSD